RAGGRLPHRVLEHEVRDVHDGGVCQHDHRLGADGDALLRRLAGPPGRQDRSPSARRLPDPGRGLPAEDRLLPLPVCLGALDAPALPLRPAHEPGLESALSARPAADLLHLVARPEGKPVSLETLLTNLIAFVAIFSALMVVFHRNPMVSVVFLIVNLMCIALFFLFLDAQFLFAIQIIVYAGAIMVLFIFVVMLLNLRHSEEARPTWRVQRILAYVGGPLLVAALWSALWKRGSSSDASTGSFSNGFGSAEDMGRLLFSDYLFQFEAASVLLVVAMIGAVFWARRKES